MEQQTIQDYPTLNCNKHQNRIEFIYLKNDYNSKLVCDKCILQNKLNLDYLIEIKNIFLQNEQQIFKQLPLNLSDELYQQLISKNIQDNNDVRQIEQINNIFDKYTKNILDALETHKQQLINHIKSVEIQRSNSIKLYNDISSKEELKQQIIEYQNNPNQLDQYMTQFIQNKQKSSFQDNQNLEDSLKQHISLTKQFNLDYVENNLLKILEIIKSTHMLNQLQLQQQQSQILEQIQIQEVKKQESQEIPSSAQQPLIKEWIEINSLQKLKSISNLNLYENISINLPSKSINDKDMKQLSESLQNCLYLTKTRLILQDNQINNNGITYLSKGLQCCKNITELQLWLKNNQFGQIGLDQLGNSFKSFINLKVLYLELSENDMSDKSIQSLLDSIKSQINLTELYIYLESTKIGEQNILYLSDTLKQLTNICSIQLNLSNNNVEDDELIYLFESIKQLSSNLTQLKLLFQNNNIGNKSVSYVIETISSCSNLSHLFLDLSNNNNINYNCRMQLENFKNNIKIYCKKIGHAKIIY